MKRVYFLILMSLFSTFPAQKKDNCKSIINRYYDFDLFNNPPTESVKKCLSKCERKIKIEIINKGDYKDLIQNLYVEFKKVKNNDFSPILKYSENTPDIIVEETYDKINWRAEGGIINKYTVFITQRYSGAENNPNIALKELEIYETTAPISSGVLWIMGTYRKDFDHSIATNLTKTINVYSDNKLIISKTFDFNELNQIGGVPLEFNAVEK